MLEVEAAEEVEVEAGAFIGAEEAVHTKFPSSSAVVDVDDEDDALEFFIIQLLSLLFACLAQLYVLGFEVLDCKMNISMPKNYEWDGIYDNSHRVWSSLSKHVAWYAVHFIPCDK